MTSSAQPLVTASRGPRAPLVRAGIRQRPTPQSHESLELSRVSVIFLPSQRTN